MSRRSFVLLAPLAFCLACSNAPERATADGDGESNASSGSSKDAHYYRLQLAKIVDSQGFEQPVEVARFLIPADWTGEGGVLWDQKQFGCPANIVNPYFRATSPDGLSGIEVFPGKTWQYTDDPTALQMYQQAAANGTGCPVGPPTNSADYLRQTLVPASRQGASVVESKALTEVTEAKRAAYAAEIQTMLSSGTVRSFQLDAGAVRLEYTRNGQPVEEWLTTTVGAMVMPTSSVTAMMNGNFGMTAAQTYTVAEYTLALRAPRGRFDEQLAATIIASIRTNPAYQAAVTRFQNNMNNIALQGARDRARIWREANAEIQNTIQESYRNQQAAQDRTASQFSQYIRGVETYQNPSTGEQIELTGGYEGAWVGPRGVYLLTDDPNFNPSVEFQEDWTRLNPARN